MIFLSWEMHRLHWAFCLHVSFIDIFISFRQYLFPFPFYFFWQVLTKKNASMWGHYGSKVLRVYSRLLNGASDPATDFLWWYRPFMTHFQLLEGLKCESQRENNGRVRSRGTLSGSQHFGGVEGCAGASGRD